jgi:hypothetical protein
MPVTLTAPQQALLLDLVKCPSLWACLYGRRNADRTLGALERRGLVELDVSAARVVTAHRVTDAGRAALST